MYWVFQELFKVRNKIEKNEKHSENISLDAFLVQKTEENVMNKEEFFIYIIDFAVDTLWDDLKRREQLRALFTSWCFIFGIDADTKECDGVLFTIREALEFQANVEEFEQYMIELIV